MTQLLLFAARRKQPRRTTRVLRTCEGIPGLSNAVECSIGEPADEEATHAEVMRIAAVIRERNMELVRRGKVGRPIGWKPVKGDEDE